MSIAHASSISHVALKTLDVEQQAKFYTQMVGLGETERDNSGRVYLRCNENHHAVVLIPSTETGIDHYALHMGSTANLEAAAAALSHAGIPYETETNTKLGQGNALRLRDPDGYVIELIGEMTQVNPHYGPRAVQPRKLGHITLLVQDCKQSAAFYSEVLGFRISDWVDDIFLWMRCNPDHHGIAFAKAPADSKLHHFAFEVKDFSYLARQADHLMNNNHTLLYGPGRHGPGENHFEYFRDPENNLIEFLSNIQQIWDDTTYEPKIWDSRQRWVNLWGPEGPADFL